MKLVISSKKLKLTPAIKNFIQVQMRKYLKLGQKIKKITYKFKSHPGKKSGLTKFSCELKIDIPKKPAIIIKDSANDLYSLIDTLSEKAAREVREHKAKQNKLTKRGLIKGKKLLRRLYRRVRPGR